MEYVRAMQHHPPKEVRKAQRIIFSVVYNADEKSSLIPVLISRLEYRRSEKRAMFGRTEASSCIRTENIIIYPPTFVTRFECIQDATVKESCQRYFQMDWREEPGVTWWKGTRGFWQAVEEAEDKTQHKRCKCKNQEKKECKDYVPSYFGPRHSLREEQGLYCCRKIKGKRLPNARFY